MGNKTSILQRLAPPIGASLLRCHEALRRGLAALSELAYPDYCAACDAPVRATQIFCTRCGPCPAPPVSVGLRCSVGGAYEPPLSTAIRRFKFSQRADLAGPLARLLPWPQEVDVCASAGEGRIVPVPLHYTRLVERGFNPAALLGRALSHRVGATFCPELLRRQRSTAQQARLPARERRANVAGAFLASPRVRGQRVVLVDDVVTTGSTLEACCQALYAAGVQHVTLLALAAAPLA